MRRNPLNNRGHIIISLCFVEIEWSSRLNNITTTFIITAMFSYCAKQQQLVSRSIIFTTFFQNTDYFRLTAIIEPESHEETTYLNTQSMNMMYPPHYLLDDEIATNYNSKSMLF